MIREYPKRCDTPKNKKNSSYSKRYKKDIEKRGKRKKEKNKKSLIT